MANGNNKRLKAYVRFDGSGRVVPSSLILQRNKPKVGSWEEIPANECCNYVPTTTTTTSSTSTTTTTAAPLAFRMLFDSVESANILVGDASDVADWNTFFNLPTLGTAFTSVSIVGSEIFLYGGANIQVKNLLLDDYNFNTFLININDELGSITSVGQSAFAKCDGLLSVNLPACLSLSSAAFFACGNLTTVNMVSLLTASTFILAQCPSLTTVNMPSLTALGNSGFYLCTALTTISLPSVLTIDSGAFLDSDNLTTISLPSCTNLGATVGNNNVFNGITGNTITLTVPSALMTVNAGSPDGDIQFLQANNTVTVVTV